MDGKRQLEDDGAVIGYSPNLYYKKNIQTNSTISNESDKDKDTQGFLSPKSLSQAISSEPHSKALTSFASNSPSVALNVLDFADTNIRKLIDKVSSVFNTGNYDKYNDINGLLSALENNNEQYINKFLEYHRNSIEADIVPEIIDELAQAHNRVNAVSNIIKHLYYGDDNISLEEATQIDTDCIVKMQQYENNGPVSYINYPCIAYDGCLCNTIKNYGYKTNANAERIASIAFMTDSYDTTISSNTEVLKSLFDDINTEVNKSRYSYSRFYTIDTIDKTFYNFYSKREKINSLYDMIESISSNTLINKLTEYQKDVDLTIHNINRVLVGCYNHLNNIYAYEKDKKNLMSIYASLTDIF